MRHAHAACRRTSAARACFAVALSVASIGAAAATSSASLQNFTITVEDLNLNDGIEAGYTFLLSDQVLDARALVTVDAEPVVQQDFKQPWGPSSVQLDAGGTLVRASAGEGSIFASGQGPAAFHHAIASRRGLLEVAPNTRLVFTGDASAAASIDSPQCTPPLCEISFARLVVWAGISSFTEMFSLNALAHPQNPPDSLTGSFNFAHENNFDHTREYNVHLYAETFATLGPVPEPQTYALMLAGLALCGWMSRRRGRHFKRDQYRNSP
jgi:hypothetical protein